MADEQVDQVFGALPSHGFRWANEARKDMERELTVHVVAIVCMRAVGVRLMHQLREFAVQNEMEEFGVGFRFPCRFPEGGVSLIVDRSLIVQLSGDTVVVLLPDDALCGGATVTSRWTRSRG